MGYSVYVGAVDNIYKINNKEYNNKLSEVNKVHKLEIERKNKEINDLNDSIRQIQKTNNKKSRINDL